MDHSGEVSAFSVIRVTNAEVNAGTPSPPKGSRAVGGRQRAVGAAILRIWPGAPDWGQVIVCAGSWDPEE